MSGNTGLRYGKETLQCLVKRNNLMELLPIFLNCSKEDDFKITPSQFVKEMCMSTEERYNKLVSSSLTCKSEVPNPLNVDLSPRVIVFQSFEERKTYNMPLQVRNRQKSLMPLKITCPRSAYFSVRFAGAPVSKVAPGLSADYDIVFTPKEKKDYSHYITLKTEVDSFYVPLIAIGPRALLDIPDEITIESVPVKISRTKIVIVRNIGSVPAYFRFVARGCFRVEPMKCHLPVQDSLQLSVTFESSVTGSYSETLSLHLETGEILSIQLHGSAENVGVRLSKNSLIHDDTFVGLRRSKSFYLQNNSQSLIKYSWKRNKTIEEDFAIIQRMKDKYEAVKDLEVIKDTKQNYLNLCSHKEHELAWERILQDELRLLEKDEFRFQHSAFTIEPESGTLFPKATAEMISFFEPNDYGALSAEAYLEVSGREERLVFSMKGNGLGPLIVFSVETLDIDFIFLCSLHSYEVVAINQGDIPGTITFLLEPLVFGGKVEVAPRTSYLKPGEHASIIITFTSNRQGDFTEKLNFLIAESKEIVSINLIGKIVSPTLHFDKNLIDFGTISVGFPTSKEVTLSNLSMVPVTFSLRVLSEGSQPSMSYERFSKFVVKPHMPKSPREFEINPVEGVVEPFSSRTVTLTLTANIARKWVTHLMVDMWDSETESVSCPIRFNSQIATLTLEPDKISIPFCFLNFPYTRIINLRNTSRIPAFFYIVPEKDVLISVTFTANISQGVIQPFETAKISLTITTKVLGRQTAPLKILTFGHESPYDLCSIVCVGQGPVITIEPGSLDWGEVRLLEESQKCLTVKNESPIPAIFTAYMQGKTDSLWTVNPTFYTLSPEEQVSLTVFLCVRDRGKYRDVLRIQVQNGKTLSCSTSAIGVGNSLLFQPDINGTYNLGTLFSYKKYNFDVEVTNKGTKSITLIWCPNDDYKSFASSKFVNPPELTFKIEPTKLEVSGGTSKIVNLEVYNECTGTFKQRFYCHANFGGLTRELYMTSEITASFSEPLIKFDKSEMRFYYNNGPSNIDTKFTDVVNAVNVSIMPLIVNVTSNHPFYIVGNKGKHLEKEELEFASYESKEIVIFFKGEEIKNRYCRVFKDKLNLKFKDHSKRSSVSLVGEVNYPNVVILPRTIDFECIPIGTSAYREFILVNVSPVPVYYDFYWDEELSSISHLEISDYSVLERALSPYQCTVSELSLPYEDGMTIGSQTVLERGAEKSATESDINPPKNPTMTMPDITIEESDIKDVLFPIVEKYYTCNDDLVNAYKMARSSAAENSPAKPAFTQFFDITPFYGRLEKFESQIISVCFQPDRAMDAHVTAQLRIDCGPTESVLICAQAANLRFELNKTFIDFGRQLFSETGNEYLRIVNTSNLAFDYETNTVDAAFRDVSEDLTEAGVLIITPRAGHVSAKSEAFLRIHYQPRVPGKFEEQFLLRIGYLDPIKIYVTGVAVFPQICCSLPRREISTLCAEIGYSAVASLTTDWLLTKTQCDGISMNQSFSEYFQVTGRDRVLSERDAIELSLDNWSIVRKNDSLPSNVDIELAIERILAVRVLSTGPEAKNMKNISSRSIPNFMVPSYDIDLGVIVAGRSIRKTFSIINYGPLPAVLYVTFPKDQLFQMIKVKLKNRCEIKVGEVIEVTLEFNPKRSRFTEQYEKIECFFYIEVYRGAKVPLKVMAAITYPVVIPSTKSLNFGEVKCGNCKVMYLKLKNFGCVPAAWYLSFRITPRDVTSMHQSGFVDGQTVFHLGVNKGTLYPNETCLLQLSFKPNFGGKFLASLIASVEEGYEENKIALMGEGIESCLKILEPSLIFEPTLPYPRNYQKCFTVQNLCSFPVEFYFSDLDDQIVEEERLLRAIMAYYQTTELLLPCRSPGDPLPKELYLFYDLLVENLIARQLEKEREKRMIPAESLSFIANATEDSASSDTLNRKRVRSKKASSASRPRSSATFHAKSNPAIDINTFIKEKTPEEIEELLIEYIKVFLTNDLRFDPVRTALNAVLPKKNEDLLEIVQGLIVILHSAPRTNIIRFTAMCERVMNRPVLSIDRIILEEMVLSRSSSGVLLKELVNKVYEEQVGTECSLAVDERDSISTEEPREQLQSEVYDDLQRKVLELFEMRENNLKKNRSNITNADNLNSRDSAKKDKMSAPNVRAVPQTADIFEGFEELVFDILRHRLQTEALNGVLVENLNSRWIPNAVTALKTLIKACGNVTDILVICLINSYQKYTEKILQKEKEEEDMRQNLKNEGLRRLEEEPEASLDELNLSEEDKKEIIDKFLGSRQEAYNAYMKTIEERGHSLQTGKGSKKKVVEGLSTVTTPKAQPNRERDKSNSNISHKTGEKSNEKNKREQSIRLVSHGNGGLEVLAEKSAPARRDDSQEENQFIAYEEEIMEIKNFLEFWDRRTGLLVESQAYKEKKSATPRKHSKTTEAIRTEVGVPLWLVDSNNPTSSVIESVCISLMQSLSHRKKSIDESWASSIPEAAVFSVVTAPQKRHPIPLLPEFTLASVERNVMLLPAEDFPESTETTGMMASIDASDSQKILESQLIQRPKRKSVDHGKRKIESRSSVSAKNGSSKKSFEHMVTEAVQMFKSRMILQEGESAHWSVRFCPSSVAKYEQYYHINSVLSQNTYIIKCIGICDIPRLDMNPEKVFERTAFEKPKNLIYSPSFFYSSYCFDFGSFIRSQYKDDSHGRELQAIFSLTNISSLPVELTVMFADDAVREQRIGSQNFEFDPTTAFVKPNQSVLLNVHANPVQYGVVEEVLLLFVKGNPKIEMIKMKCYGVKANLILEPKHIDFDRLLLYRRDRRRISFINGNLIPLFIALSDYSKLQPQITFSAVKGWIQPLTTFSIDVDYEARETQVIDAELIQVQVYDRVDTLVQTLNFTISAEAYDASVDIFFSAKEENHVDFGEIRMEVDYKKPVTLRNTGKYPLGFKIVIDYRLLKENGNEEFYVSPSDGKLIVGKPFTLDAHLKARNEIDWKRLPLFRVSLTEPYIDDELIASIPIEVSAKSFFSRYVIQPTPELNFGCVLVGSRKSATVTLENRGHFVLTYLVGSSDAVADDEAEINKKSPRKASEASSKDVTRKLIPLKIGCFDVWPSSGTVDVCDASTIHVTFSAEEAAHYEETVFIHVSESPPHLKNGNELKIVAEGCIPRVNFGDFASIFREHHITQSHKDISHLSDFDFKTIFAMDSNQLCFKNVCLGKTVEARIHFENIGQIDCKVLSSVSKPHARRSRTTMESNGGNFWVRPDELIIPPYESRTFVIFFRSDTIQNYKAQISFTLDMPEKLEDVLTTLNLCATVCTPQIEIVQPIPRTSDGIGLVNFSPTTPGRSSKADISFKNTGKIESKVILELINADKGIFTLSPKPETEQLLNFWERNKPIECTTVIGLSPGQRAEFEASFNPADIRSYSGELRLSIVDNGFENPRYLLKGEAFLEEVVLENVQTTMPFAEEYPSYSSSFSQTTLGRYILKVGHCFVDKKKKILVRLSNKTEKDYFRFEWVDVPNCISVQPEAGHLYPGAFKEILFVFLPPHYIELNEVPLICLVGKIRFVEFPPNLSWDTRLIHFQTLTEFDKESDISINKTSSRQESLQINEIQMSGHEPDHVLVSGSERELVIEFSAVADYARVLCQTTSLNFLDTFIFQTRTYPLSLENVGKVAFDYLLEFFSVTYEPLKTDAEQQTSLRFLTNLKNRSSATKYSSELAAYVHLAKPEPLENESTLELVESEQVKDNSYNPFRLENCCGTIQPNEKAFCNIIFSPLDVHQYKAVIKMKIDNVDPNHALPDITIDARSIMPYCHFDIPESDYLQSGQRDYSRPGPIGFGPGVPLDSHIKAIEIKVLGVRVTKHINFYVINPTEEDYVFEWSNVTQNEPLAVQCLHCTSLNGSIQAGRQKQMEFVFVSQNTGLYEYFWKFSIPQHRIETIFLFVVSVQEPVIYFLLNNLVMRPTSVGVTVTDFITLVNEDDASSDFMLVPASLYSEGHLNTLKVHPLSGTIMPKSEIKLRVSFTGKTSGKIIFNVKCKLKKLQNPIAMTVETLTFSVEPRITFEDLSKVKHVANPLTNNIIDLGKELQTEHPETIKFFISSTSKISFNYQWTYDRRDLVAANCSLTFSHTDGHVTSFSRAECDLTILFTKKSTLTKFPIQLKITRGPVYTFLVSAGATNPSYELSFMSYDFGYCYPQNCKESCYSTNLIFRNKDKVPLLVENTTNDLKNFVFDFNEAVVEPGKDLQMTIRFNPKEFIRYKEILFVTICSLFTKQVTLTGCGIEFKVGLTNLEDSNIRLGATRVGSRRSQSFSLTNKGLAPATILIGFTDQLPVEDTCFSHDIDLAKGHRLSDVLAIVPSSPFTILPKEDFTLRIEHTPRQRTSFFSETVCMQFQDVVTPLCVITGSSVGPEFSLDKNYISFGAVVANYSTILKLKLINSGDIGARFQWETEDLTDDFSVAPTNGYLSAESDVVISVGFHPKSVGYCKATVECRLFISDTQTYPPLNLKISGDCVDLPQPTKSILFECRVRSFDSKMIEISNRCGTDWQLVPTFSGKYFEGLDVFFVPHMSTAEYEIVYKPLTMTKPDDFHMGSLFICLPDGTGQLYNLMGASLPPDPVQVIVREIPCKTKYVELLKVRNWLRSHQRFRVSTVCVAGEGSEEPVFRCSGLEQFELAPLSEKEYKLDFFAYKVGKLRFNVNFVNKETEEFVWFDITFNVVACGPLEVIAVRSVVRQLCPFEVKLENPLESPIQYKLECSNSEVLIPAIEPVSPKSMRTVTLSYRPLHPGEKREQLKIICSELGLFPVELRLTAVEASTQHILRFETCLGSTDVQTITVPNFSNSQTVLLCRVTSDEFKVEERATVAAQGTATLEVTYEPSSLGTTIADLLVESEEAGNFKYSLIGNSLKPLAKGPYILRPGSGVTITFKNVLKETKTFQVYVDNPAFSVKSSAEEISSGSECKITVTLQRVKNLERTNAKYPIMGQLVVECYNPFIKWQYYLKGILDKTSISKT